MPQKLIQFFIVTNGELEMTGDDTGLLVVARRISGKLQDFGSKIFEHSCEIDRGT